MKYKGKHSVQRILVKIKLMLINEKADQLKSCFEGFGGGISVHMFVGV